MIRSTGRLRLRATALLTGTVLVLGMLTGTALADPYRVTRNHDGGWHMQHTTCEGPNETGSQTFVAGPQGTPGNEGDGSTTPGDSPSGGPPAGVGSLQMQTPEGTELEYFRNTNYADTLLANVTDMTYWTYVGENITGLPDTSYIPAIYIVLHLDTDANGTVDDRLIFEPEYQREEQHPVQRATWQKWIAADADTGEEAPPEGRWFLASQYAKVVSGEAATIEFHSLEEWAADTKVGPDATIENPDGLGGVVLAAGCGAPSPWTGFTGYTDDFRIMVSATQDTYNFDPPAPSDPQVLNCEPETDSNPTRTSHTVTCTVTNGQTPLGNFEVDVEATGANDPDGNPDKTSPDFECTTATGGATHGTCSFIHSGTPDAGLTTYVAWVDDDDDNSTVEADQEEGQPEASAGGDTREPDTTDVVTKTWVGRTAQGGAVDAEPEDDTNEVGENHTITATVYDQFGDPLVADTEVKFEFFAFSANDSDGNTPASEDDTCTTKNSSSCSITYSSSKPGADRVCVWINEDPAMTGDSSSGKCDGEDVADSGDTPGSADSAGEPGDDVDVVRKTWVRGPATQLDCEPESVVTPTGSTHRITCTAKTTRGALAQGVNIDAEITGANDPDDSDSRTSPDLTCTTGTDGKCQLTHGPGGTGTSFEQDLTTYRAWIDENNSDGVPEADPTEGRDETQNPGQTTTEPDNTDVVETRWQSSPLECEPETSSGPVDTTHRIICSAPAGTMIDIEASGANDPDGTDSNTSPDFSCTTSSSGSCTVVHSTGTSGGTTRDTGTTTYRAWVDADGSDANPEADTAEGQNENLVPGSTREPDTTDVVTRTWTQEAKFTCNDGEDNDADGRIDYPNDPGCTSPTDTSEADVPDPAPTPTPTPTGTTTPAPTPSDSSTPSPRAQCADGTDNDNDGATDFPDDAGCSSSADDTELGDGFPEQEFGGPTGEPVTSGPCAGFTTGSVQQDPNGSGLIIVGTSGADALQGSESGDLICGLGGADTINGAGGDDTIYGHGGKDAINGGDGNDDIFGNNGKDVIIAGAGVDTIAGGNQNDNISGGDDDDTLRGQGGWDTLKGNAGDDLFIGGGGNDIVQGGGGADVARGKGGDDVMKGFSGKDRLIGAGGDDILRGSAGNDFLKGGSGDDVLNGGGGNDTCRPGGGSNVVRRCE